MDSLASDKLESKVRWYCVSVASVPSCGGKESFSDGAVVFAGAEERSLRR